MLIYRVFADGICRYATALYFKALEYQAWLEERGYRVDIRAGNE